MKYYILLGIVTVFTLSCRSNHTIDSEYIDNVFADTEIQQLSKILNYVDSIVLSSTQQTDINLAYHSFFNDYINDTSSESRLFPFSEERKYSFLLSLDSTFYNEIWHWYVPIRIYGKDTILSNPEGLYSMDFYPYGKFGDYLKLLSQNEEYFQTVHERVTESGSIGPTITAGLFYNHQKFNFSESDMRLWTAIILLSMEESAESKVSRYLNK